MPDQNVLRQKGSVGRPTIETVRDGSSPCASPASRKNPLPGKSAPLRCRSDRVCPLADLAWHRAQGAHRKRARVGGGGRDRAGVQQGWHELRRIGVNLNQIAHHCHRHQTPPPAELSHVIAALLTLMRRLLGHDHRHQTLRRIVPRRRPLLPARQGGRQGSAEGAEAQDGRARWFTDTRNCANFDPELALDEMWRTAEAQQWLKAQAGGRTSGRTCEDPVKTLSISWHKDDAPTPEHMIGAADAYLRAMNWHEHQAVYIGHRDTEHRHLHIVLNRVHPETGRTLMIIGSSAVAGVRARL